MEHFPSPEERDWKGVCMACGKMATTIVVDKSIDRLKKVEELKAAYASYGVDFSPEDGSEIEVPHDFREVTACCLSEDFIPFPSAIRCQVCQEWIDHRWEVKRGEGYVCPMCAAEGK